MPGTPIADRRRTLPDSKQRPRPLLHFAIFCGALVAAVRSAVSIADGLQPLLSAMEDSSPLLDLRLRSETVDQAGFADQADALTLRGRLGFETGEAWDTSLLAEADLMAPLDERYNSTINHETQYPTVADPENYGLDRLELANTSLPDTKVIVGRQRINLDDQRFVGSVEFRQNEQTFDSAQIINTSIPQVTIDLTYLDRVNRVYGARSPVGRYSGKGYLANASYGTSFGKLTAFGYLLAFDQAHPQSTRTVGARFAGARSVRGWVIHYSASYASQKPYADNTLRFSNDYYAGEATGTLGHLTLGGGLEVLGGNGTIGFSTPLATLHKFNGWADEFLTTPVNGLQDRYATVGYAWKAVGILHVLSVTAVYHGFRSDRLGMSYGTETDLQLLGKWRRFTGSIAFADYAAGHFAADTRKLWVTIDCALGNDG
jgi:hypothetical protein